jgi:hypothetical protein
MKCHESKIKFEKSFFTFYAYHHSTKKQFIREVICKYNNYRVKICLTTI